MAHKDSKWPKIETAKAFKKENSDRLCAFFDNGEFKTLNKSGFLEIKYYQPKDIMFRHLSVKETVFNETKNRCQKKNCFCNGHITQHLTSVDIEELGRNGWSWFC